MLTKIRNAACLLGASALAAMPVAAHAEEANEIQYIVGYGAGQAERELRNLDFTFVKHERDRRGHDYSYWWDEGTDDCVRVEERGQRVVSIRDASDQDCGHHLNADVTTALGVAAGAAILGAIFGSGGDDDDRNSYERRDDHHEYDRGYADGLHNAAYHNRSRNDEYSEGYRAGVNQRQTNLRHHHGHGGYRETVRFNDLRGRRAAGAMDTIERRGFRQVDNFTSGNTRYSIQWNRETRQCVQMTIADGRIYDIRDIGSNPRCR